MEITTDTQKQTAITNGVGVFNIQHSIKAIRDKAFNWREKANSELYHLLYNCLLLVLEVEKLEGRERKLVSIDIDEMLEAKNFKATKLPNQIVQLVFDFDMDRKLVSKYATVLNKFIETEQSESRFVSWLTDNNGIYGVLNSNSTTKSKSGLSITEKANATLVSFSDSTTIASIENVFDVDTDKPFALMVVPNAEGKLDVKRVITTSSLLNPIFASYFDEDVANRKTDADAEVENEVREELQKAS